MSVEQTLYWVKALIFQGGRLLTAEKIEYHNYTITRMEEQFFLIAVNKSIRWLIDLKSQKVLISEIFLFFLNVSLIRALDPKNPLSSLFENSCSN